MVETGEPDLGRRVDLGGTTSTDDRSGVVDPVPDGPVREDDGNIAANKVFQEKRVKGIEPSTFSLGILRFGAEVHPSQSMA